jgi:hypothetical protein
MGQVEGKDMAADVIPSTRCLATLFASLPAEDPGAQFLGKQAVQPTNRSASPA